MMDQVDAVSMTTSNNNKQFPSRGESPILSPMQSMRFNNYGCTGDTKHLQKDQAGDNTVTSDLNIGAALSVPVLREDD